VKKCLHGVAEQAAQRDRANARQDLSHLRLAVVLAQPRDRIRIAPVQLFGVVLSKQDRRGLGRVFGLLRLDLVTEDLVHLLERDALGRGPVGVTPLAVAAVRDRGHAEHDLLAQRRRGLRPD
jgi:hypothetical protein